LNRRVAGALVAGALFGVGLVISGMTDPRNVIGFLDFSGRWNPRLVAVMAGAVGVHATLLFLLGRVERLRALRPLPRRDRRVDPALIIGSAMFGVGWGLSGYCPGPAIVSLGSGARSAVVFVAAMIAGVLAAGFVRARSAVRSNGCEAP